MTRTRLLALTASIAALAGAGTTAVAAVPPPRVDLTPLLAGVQAQLGYSGHALWELWGDSRADQPGVQPYITHTRLTVLPFLEPLDGSEATGQVHFWGPVVRPCAPYDQYVIDELIDVNLDGSLSTIIGYAPDFALDTTCSGTPRSFPMYFTFSLVGTTTDTIPSSPHVTTSGQRSSSIFFYAKGLPAGGGIRNTADNNETKVSFGIGRS